MVRLLPLLALMTGCSRETRMLRRLDINPATVAITAEQTQRDDGAWEATGYGDVELLVDGNRTWTFTSARPAWVEDPRKCFDDVPLFWFSQCGNNADCSYDDGDLVATVHDGVFTPGLMGHGCADDDLAGTYDGELSFTAHVCRGDVDRCEDGDPIDVVVPMTLTIE